MATIKFLLTATIFDRSAYAALFSTVHGLLSPGVCTPYGFLEPEHYNRQCIDVILYIVVPVAKQKASDFSRSNS